MHLLHKIFILMLFVTTYLLLPHNTHAHQGAIMTTKSGNWSDPSIWDMKHVPHALEAVHISAGHKVVYDVQSDEVIDGVMIHGELYFSRNKNTRLKTDNNIMIHEGGNLDMGTPSDYIPKNIRTEVIFVLTQAQANAFTGGEEMTPTDIGLMAHAGSKWNTHGAPLLRTWSKLNQDAPAGTNQIIVENNVTDWYIGGQVVITGTNLPRTYAIRQSDGRETSSSSYQEERRTITGIKSVANGTQITLDQPLQYLHTGTQPFRGEAALLTRNIVITTQLLNANNQITPDAVFDDVGTRKFAHTMYMATARGNLEYTEFKYMGHYGKLGRYTTHHHKMMEESRGMILRGNSMWRTGFRCSNIHVSVEMLIEDNVCYDAQNIAFMVEPEGGLFYNRDNAFVHNIAIATHPKRFADRSNNAVSGSYRRTASFWPGQNTVNESFLGNVAANGRAETSGFHFPESGNSLEQQDGTMPFTFIANEVHGMQDHGLFSWQNVGYQREIVGSLLWKNGMGGIDWGAYANAFHIYNTQALENAISGFSITSVQAYIQDSHISVAEYDGSSINRGIFINGYVLPQYPNPAVWFARNQFKNIKGYGISQEQKVLDPITNPDQIPDGVCKPHDAPESLDDGISLKERPAFPAECSATYTIHLGNTYQNVDKPIFFGDQPNPNAWWRIHDHTGSQTNLKEFVLTRQDLTDPLRRGVVTKHLINANTRYNQDFDALLTPLNTLPTEIPITGLYNHRSISNPDLQSRSNRADFIFSTKKNYPPTVSINVSEQNKKFTVTALATDDQSVDRVEFYVDWIKIDTKTQAPYQTTIDLSHHPRKYAYFYAIAYDGTRPFESRGQTDGRNWNGVDYEQRAYSNIQEIGPEILGMGLSHTPGDIKSDGQVDLLDIIELIKRILTNATPTPESDLNTDNTLNIHDIFALVQLIFK